MTAMGYRTKIWFAEFSCMMYACRKNPRPLFGFVAINIIWVLLSFQRGAVNLPLSGFINGSIPLLFAIAT